MSEQFTNLKQVACAHCGALVTLEPVSVRRGYISSYAAEKYSCACGCKAYVVTATGAAR